MAVWITGELKRLMGIDRISNCRIDDQEAILIEETCEKDYLREDWLVQTERDYYVPVFVLKPTTDDKEPYKRWPVALTPHSHIEHGRYIYSGISMNPEEEIEIKDVQLDVAL